MNFFFFCNEYFGFAIVLYLMVFEVFQKSNIFMFSTALDTCYIIQLVCSAQVVLIAVCTNCNLS